MIGSALRAILIAVLAVSMIAGGIAVADYSATQGSGTTFASVVISLKHYMAMVICDPTNGESQCAAGCSNTTPPSICDILTTSAATTCNNGGSAANNGTYTVPAGTQWLEGWLTGGGGGAAERLTLIAHFNF